MPDESLSPALAEAYALAPDDEVVLHTLEIRHPLFEDEEGNPDSIWLVANNEDIEAPIEADGPVRGGESAPFVAMPFTFTLAPIEPGATPEIQLGLDNVDRRIIENLDRAVTDGNRIVIAYRPYLASALDDGPQMDPVPTFELSDVKVDVLRARARARVAIDMRRAFPFRVYTATEFPGLVGR